MVKDLVQYVKSFVGQKQAVAQKERQLIEDLNRVLPEIGYHVVPTASLGAEPPRPSTSNGTHAGKGKRAEGGGASAKPLACPHCDRRFARPLHLGRHMAATHSKKKRAA